MSTHDNGAIATPDWHVDPHQCPFCTVPAMVCGCEHGDRMAANIMLGEN